MSLPPRVWARPAAGALARAGVLVLALWAPLAPAGAHSAGAGWSAPRGPGLPGGVAGAPTPGLGWPGSWSPEAVAEASNHVSELQGQQLALWPGATQVTARRSGPDGAREEPEAVAGALGAVLAGVPAGAPDGPVCRFAPVFAELRAGLSPFRVGDCTEGERAGADGTTEQGTTRGLLVWRPAEGPAEGRAAFTDGAHTWVGGPADRVWERANTERFDWEPAPPGAPEGALSAVVATGWQPPTPAPCLATVAGWRRTAAGVVADVRNDCGGDRVFGLSAVLYDSAGGRPVAATGEAVWAAPAGDARAVVLPGRAGGAGGAAFSGAAAPPGGAGPRLCLDVGAAPCLVADPWLSGAVAALRTTPAGGDLLRAAAERAVELRWEATALGLLAFYDFHARAATLDRGALGGAGDWERAAVLAHELQHAADHAAGRPWGAGADCLAREAAGSQAAGRVWLQLWQGRLPVATTALQALLNGEALAAFDDPAQRARRLAPATRAQCGAGAP